MHVIKPIHVVLASAEPADQANLRALLAGTPWEPIGAASGADAVRALRRMALPIVLCDRDLDRQPWPETMRILRKARQRTCVILLGEPADPTSEDVIRRGGFDALARPYQREELLTALICAYSQCRMNWLSFTRVHANPAPAIS